MPDQLTADELRAIGLIRFGTDVRIDRTARFFGAAHIHLGSHVRIDANCVLSAGPEGIDVGDYVHFSVGATVLGRGKLVVGDFCALSAHVCVFTSNDDYTGGSIINPTVPEPFRGVTTAPVVLGRHTVIGAGSIVMPGVETGVGAAIGALSFVNRRVPDFEVHAGQPARKVGERSRSLLQREAEFHRWLREELP